MKAISISRVSTEEQKENSPEAQNFRIENYFNNRNYEIIKKFNFVESAYKLKRDTFDEIMDFIIEASKKEKIAVGFDKVDRLSRNIFDKRVAKLYELAIENRIELHFVSDGQVIDDKMSAGDKFAFGMKLGLAKYYSDAISDNVKRVFELKRRNGEWTGPVKLGYLNVPLDEENRTRKGIIIDPERGHLVAEMFMLYATGNYSLETIREEMTKKGLKSKKGFNVSKSTIENILKDSFYCGIAISRKYGKYSHIYPRLIDRETFDKCQEIRKARRTKINKEKSKDFVFKGLLKCDNCGCNITAEEVKKKNGKSYNYYSCTNGKNICKRVYVSETLLLSEIYAILGRLESISIEAQEKLVLRLRELNESEVEYHQKQIERIQSEYKRYGIMKDKLTDTYLDPNNMSITKLDYDKKMLEYNDKMQVLEIELSEHTKADFDYKTTISTVFSLSRKAKEIFDSSETNEKRMILNYLLQNSTLNEKTPCFTMRSPFNLILGLATSPDWLPG